MIRHPEKIKKFNPTTIKKPNWLKVKAPTSKKYFETLDIVKSHNLVTVCQEAACPNIGECWEKKPKIQLVFFEIPKDFIAI